MLKLISSAYLPQGLNPGLEIYEDPVDFVKKAQAMSPDLFDFNKLKPDDKHVAIHAVAIGDYERYGFNRNGDGFEKEANIKYHPTFVKHAFVYQHHKNHDPKLKVGFIKAAAYNPQMGRIELVIHADKEKAASHLERFEKTGEVPFSMGCRVPGDYCSRCNTFRKTASDPNQCDHVKYALGKLNDDGTYNGVFNREPKFFDFSFVTRPADRIAWNLQKVASQEFLTADKLAEEIALCDPDGDISMSVMRKRGIARDMYEAQEFVKRGFIEAPIDIFEQQLFELTKCAAADSFSDSVLMDQLRVYNPEHVFYGMAKLGAVLDIEGFFKYALGPEYCKVQPIMSAIKQELRTGLTPTDFEKAAENCKYDVDCDTGYTIPGADVAQKIAHVVRDTFKDGNLEALAICYSVEGNIKTAEVNFTEKSNNPFAKELATEYLSYKLAAADAMKQLDNLTWRQMVVLAAQNLLK